jgi:hypothetical protein
VGAAVSSCSGVGGAITISTSHGNPLVALLIFTVMQIWPMSELTLNLFLKWRYASLYEFIARKAAEHPENLHLRTLLVDVASTNSCEVGDRVQVRKNLK